MDTTALEEEVDEAGVDNEQNMNHQVIPLKHLTLNIALVEALQPVCLEGVAVANADAGEEDGLGHLDHLVQVQIH